MPSKKKKYNARFPPARVKKIMQTDEDVGKVAAAVPVIISRALELFIESLIKKTSETTQSRNAKTLTATHIKQTIHSERKFDFLRDLVASVPDHQAEEDTDSSSNNKRHYTPRQKKDKDKNVKRKKKKNSSESSEEEEEDDDESTETDEEHAQNESSHPYGASTSSVSPNSPQLPFVSPSQQMIPSMPQPLISPVSFPHMSGYNPLHQNNNSNVAQPINLCTKEEPHNLSSSSNHGQSSSFMSGESVGVPPGGIPSLAHLGPSSSHMSSLPSTSSTMHAGEQAKFSSLNPFMPAVPNTQEDDDYDT